MMKPAAVLALVLLAVAGRASASDGAPSDRDILVTFENDSTRAVSGGFGAPFRHRLRYSISAEAERKAAAIEHDYALVEVDRWPIRSLSVVCIVYRLSGQQDRDEVLARLNADSRIESAQPLNRFETAESPVDRYNDRYAALQYGLTSMRVIAAHQYSRGANVRIAVVDGPADVKHEDLQGRIARTEMFVDIDDGNITEHGTAIASLIAANANNAKGIVGVAPDAQIEMFVACWAPAGSGSRQAVCSSFTLAKALDALLADPPDIVNLSLVGPYDPLLARLLRQADRAGAILIAASAEGGRAGDDFPASMDEVIGIASAGQRSYVMPASFNPVPHPDDIFSPGNHIMVALPNDRYDFRSGSSLAAAQVSGVVALLLSVSPQMSSAAVHALLLSSQATATAGSPIVNACAVLHLADRSRTCR